MEKSAGRSAAPQGRIVVALTVLALARLYIADPPAFRPCSTRARGRGTACRNCALAEPDQRGQAGDDLFLPPEALEEDHIRLVVQIRDLQDHRRARLRVDGLEDGGHPSASQELDEVVLIDAVADLGIAHQRRSPSASRRGRAFPQDRQISALALLQASQARQIQIETNCLYFRFMLSSAAASPRAGREHGACQPEGTEKRGIGACPSWKLQVWALVAVAFCKARRFRCASPARPPASTRYDLIRQVAPTYGSSATTKARERRERVRHGHDDHPVSRLERSDLAARL